MLIRLIFFFCLMGKVLAISCSEPTIFSGQKAMSVKIATNASGAAVAMWIAKEKEGEAVYVSSKAAITPWTTPERISKVEKDITVPRIFIDEHGNAFVTWNVEILDEESIFQICEQPSGSVWERPISISYPNGHVQWEAGHLTQAFESVGKWSPDFSTSSKMILSVKKELHQEPQWDYIAQTCCSHYEQLVLASNKEGALFAVWERKSADGKYIHEYSLRKNGESWDSVGTLPTAFTLRGWEMQAVIDPSENITIIWRSPSNGQMMCVQRLFGVWSQEPIMLTQKDQWAASCKLSIDHLGNIILAWTRKVQNQEMLYVSYKPVGNDWQKGLSLSPKEYDCCCYDVRADLKGKFVVCWGQSTDNAVAIHGATFSTEDQTWSLPEQLSPEGLSCWSPYLSFSEGSNGFLGWVTEDTIQITELK
ncbi:MAG: hypothetical protein JSR58_00485 [Verrucomicrobia bacterium]|nr:hypothetical protein [Verrucomicrobiota bacterium]